MVTKYTVIIQIWGPRSTSRYLLFFLPKPSSCDLVRMVDRELVVLDVLARQRMLSIVKTT